MKRLAALILALALAIFGVAVFLKSDQPNRLEKVSAKTEAEVPVADPSFGAQRQVPGVAANQRDSAAIAVIPPDAPLSARIDLRKPDAVDIEQLAERRKLKPRRPLKRRSIDLPSSGNLLVKIKFNDALLARSDGRGGVTMLDTPSGEKFSRFAAAHDLEFKPEIDLDSELLSRVESRAAEASGIAQPELRSLFLVRAPKVKEITDAHALTVAMNSMPGVEYANLSSLNDLPPPPEDIPPVTPDHRPLQTWRGLGSVSGGASIDYAWSHSGRGEGVGVIDIEYNFNPAHEDLVDLGIQDFSIGNPSPADQETFDSRVDHGTGSFGVLAASHNSYGVSGAAPFARLVGFVSELTDDDTGSFITCPDPDGSPNQHQATSRRGRAIVIATDNLIRGDVILLEMQTSAAGATGFVPAETDETVFCTTKLATDANIVVVAAAGNVPSGEPTPDAQNLDANLTALNTWRSWGDSGAIIVGAGSADTQHTKQSYSAYGARVDVQAWGENVYTTGTGSDIPGGPADPNQEYRYFSGTSSASAVVAATAAAVQSVRRGRSGANSVFDSQGMRALLKNNGNPQQAGAFTGSIGPAVDAQKAIDSFIPSISPDTIEPGNLPIAYNFNGETIASLRAWDSVDSVGAGTASIVSGELLLSNEQPSISNSPTASIADWHLKLNEPIENLVLRFDHRVIQDNYDDVNEDGYLGMDDVDGVFISNDGARWTEIPLLGFAEQTPADGIVKYAASLNAAALKGGFELDGDIRIRFQRYGGNNVSGEGRVFDEVQLDIEQLGEFVVSHTGRVVTEGQTAGIVVGRIENVSSEATVDYRVVSQTAIVGGDFVAAGATGTLTFKPGASEQRISVGTIDDVEREHTETFRIILENPTNGTVLGEESETLVQMIDNDHDGPGSYHFARAGRFELPEEGSNPFGPAGPPPITLNISGVDLSAPVNNVIVKISDLTRDTASGLDAILEAPDGTFVKLMSDISTGFPATSVNRVNLTFEGGAAAIPLNTALVSGVYSPTDHSPGSDQLLNGTNVNAGNSQPLSFFDGMDPNGTWKLHLVKPGGVPGAGVLEGGYEIIIETRVLPIFTRIEEQPNGNYRFYWIGPAGRDFQLQTSVDLASWVDATIQTTDGTEQSGIFPDWERLFLRFVEE